MRNLKVAFLILIIVFLTGEKLFAINVSNILDLWNIRNDLGGTYTLTDGINMEKTNPSNLTDYTSETYNLGDIVKYDGYAYYSKIASNTNEPSGNTDDNWTKMWEASKGWDPIGDGDNPFHGNFDGGGKIISNLYIARGATVDDPVDNDNEPNDGENFIGLFGYVTNGSTITNASNNADIHIKNVALQNVNIRGKRGTGALIGKVDLPNINNGHLVITEECYVENGTVTGFGATGGLVGANNSQRKQVVPIIRYCWANVTVASTHPTNQALNSGDNDNPYNIKYGGLVGCNENGLTQDSYALGNVSGGDRVGGVAGCSIGGAIFRTYATGNITQYIGSDSWEGGYGPITGRVEGMLPPGLGGTNQTGSLEDSYYLSSATIGGIYPTESNGYGTADDLTGTDVFSNWDSTNVWTFAENVYPTLKSSPSSIFYFRSKATGYFSTASNWDKSETESGTYEESVLKPDYTNSYSIKVLSDDTITLQSPNDAFISSTTVEGKLIINDGATLNVENKVGDDLIIASGGELEITGTINIGQSASLIGQAGSTIRFNGSSAQSVASGISSAYNIIIDNTNGVTLPDNISIEGTLTVSSGTYTGASNVAIDGLDSPNIKHLFWPTTDYNIANYSASTSLSSSLYPNKIKRSWNISGNINDENEANRQKTITFYWNAEDDNNYNWLNPSKTPVLFDGGVKVGQATDFSIHLNDDIRVATFTYTFPQFAKTSKGDLTIGLDDDQTLPVQLSSFDVFNTNSSNVMVKWVTQSESDLDGYRIYRNCDNNLNNAQMLDVFIPGTNTSQTQTYSYIDNSIEVNGIYYYWIKMIDYDASSSFYGPAIIEVEDDFNNLVDIPLTTGLVSIYPNPFNPTTSIRYSLDSNSLTEIKIYNVRGQLVKTFDLGMQTTGFHKLVWNAKDDNGNKLPSGVYFSRMKANNKIDTKKIILLK
jgi:hypothetical protein